MMQQLVVFVLIGLLTVKGKKDGCNYLQITDGNQFLYMPDVCMASKRGANGTDTGSHMFACSDDGKSISYRVWTDNTECDSSSDYQVSLIYTSDSQNVEFNCLGSSNSSCYSLVNIYDLHGNCNDDELSSYNYQQMAVTIDTCLIYNPNDVTQTQETAIATDNSDINDYNYNMRQYQINRHKGKQLSMNANKANEANEANDSNLESVQETDRSAMLSYLFF